MDKLENTVPEVIVEKIYDYEPDPKTGEPRRLLQLRTEQDKPGGNSVLSNFLLGGNTFKDKRVAFQIMYDTLIDTFGVEEGSDLNKLFEAHGAQPIRLVTTEINHAEYEAMVNAGDKNFKGFKAKINPETKEFLVDGNGSYIYRNVKIGAVSTTDTLIEYKSTTKIAPEEVEIVVDEVVEDLTA
jgi:hypothetical protein